VKLLIISGRSGSGKSIALRALEDLSYYCVDNIPVNLLPTLTHSLADEHDLVAVSIDVRNMPKAEQEFSDILEYLPEFWDVTIIFLDASDDVLIKRYSETRRLHPLFKLSNSLIDADPDLRPLTGLDDPVEVFLSGQPLVMKFIWQIQNFISTWLPHLERNNRSYVTIAIGCTGGQHRSVYVAQSLADAFKATHGDVQIKHRELKK